MYDVVIIGGGPAGYNAALECAKLTLKTALVESVDLGGTCLNRGCVPTKSLLKSAEIYHSAQKAELFGISTANINYDMTKIYQRKAQVVTKLRDGIKFLIKKSGLDYFEGQASFIDKNTINISNLGENTAIKAKNIIIASGSRPTKLHLEGIEYTKNSDDMLEKGINGENIVIVGGGVIGCEFACFLSSLGKKVTIIEMESRILPVMDRDVSNYLSMSLKKNKVDILTSAKVLAIKKADSLLVEVERGGVQTIAVDDVIVSIGRVANMDGLHLEKAGVEYDRIIKVNENFVTSVDNIYAIGDVASKIQLAHLAEAQGVNVAHIIAGKKPIVNLDVVPSCVYTSPEIASVGKTDIEGEFVTTSKLPIGGNGKAVIEDSTVGFVKMVFDSDVLVGATIMCSRATDMIAELALAVVNKLSKCDIAKTIHAHPTLSESIAQAVR